MSLTSSWSCRLTLDSVARSSSRHRWTRFAASGRCAMRRYLLHQDVACIVLALMQVHFPFSHFSCLRNPSDAFARQFALDRAPIHSIHKTNLCGVHARFILVHSVLVHIVSLPRQYIAESWNVICAYNPEYKTSSSPENLSRCSVILQSLCRV